MDKHSTIFYAILDDGCLRTYEHNKKMVFKRLKTAQDNLEKMKRRMTMDRWDKLEIVVLTASKLDI